jgi:hypothetical protein
VTSDAGPCSNASTAPRWARTAPIDSGLIGNKTEMYDPTAESSPQTTDARHLWKLDETRTEADGCDGSSTGHGSRLVGELEGRRARRALHRA